MQALPAAADMFSFSVAMVEVFHGKSAPDLYKDVFSSHHELYLLLKEGESPPLERTDSTPNTCWRVIQQCWQLDSRERPTSEQVFLLIWSKSNSWKVFLAGKNTVLWRTFRGKREKTRADTMESKKIPPRRAVLTTMIFFLCRSNSGGHLTNPRTVVFHCQRVSNQTMAMSNAARTETRELKNEPIRTN